jgi:hypothetical protein
MPALTNAKLKIETLSGSNTAKVTALVTVNFHPQEENYIKILGLKCRLRCRVWSEDGGLNGDDDPLFNLPTKTITKDGTYTFERTVSRDVLDEDWEGNDEIYARFKLNAVAFPMAAGVKTATITGNY